MEDHPLYSWWNFSRGWLIDSIAVLSPRMDGPTVTLNWPGKPNERPTARRHLFTPDAPPPGSWGNRLYHADNLPVLEHLAAEMPGAFDLVYIDPPFNTGRHFLLSGKLAGHAYSDRHENGLAGYLSQLYVRLALIHQLLSPRGTLYLHCDHRVSSHLRLILDEIFSPANLRAQVIWHYQSGGRKRSCWSNKHDVIWMYSRGEDFIFNLDAVGVRRGSIRRNHMKQRVGPDGTVSYTIRSNGKVYSYSEDDLLTPADVWTDISHLQQKDPERTGYATQKPQRLLERIILASSSPESLVADFYCGSGTTLVTAARLGRRWIGCDSSDSAIDICQQRLASGLFASDHTIYRPAT